MSGHAGGPTPWELPHWETGYVSGAFDLFHIGHLNVIMQARAQCSRLVVGVATDRVVREMKGRDPVIPLDERIDIVRGLRDVDEVIIDDHADKFETWRTQLHYDVLFKGDDWQGTARAEALQDRLAQVGATMWFFPYTRHTSSSLLRTVLSALARTPVHLLPDDAAHPPVGHCPTCGAVAPGAPVVPAASVPPLAPAASVRPVVPSALPDSP